MGRQRKRKGDPVHGWIALDKPVDLTSTRAVAIIKRLFNAQKAGHGGTLDPLADGILPIALGEATKTSQWAMDCDKEYIFTIEWGVSTASQDKEGAIVGQSDVRPTKAEIEAVLPEFVGEISQVPPKYSAIKIQGERAYDLVREGETFEIPARSVTVYDADLIATPDSDHATIRVVSGKGFYVRAMARDLAHRLGAEGHVSRLRRTRVGALDQSRAISLSTLEALAADSPQLFDHLLPIETVLDDVPILDISASDAAAIRQGRDIPILPHLADAWKAAALPAPNDRLAVTRSDSTIIAMGEMRANRFQPKKVFQL